MATRRIICSLASKCTVLDLFGVPLTLPVNNCNKMRTNFGALMSLASLVVIGILVSQTFKSWTHFENLKIISSEQNINTQQMLDQNQSYQYDFNQANFYPYFAPQAILPNLTTLYAPSLTKYFRFQYRYLESSNSRVINLETVGCSIEKQDIMLSMEDKYIQNDKGKISTIRLCYKNESLKMGLYPDLKNNRINKTSITFNIYACQNSSQNNNSCASMEDIKAMAQVLLIQASIPQTSFDFKNSQTPKKIFYDYAWHHADGNLRNYYLNEVRTFSLYSDYGTISENYRLDSVDHSSDHMTSFFTIRGPNDPFYVYEIAVRPYVQSYFRQNFHLIDLAGIIGGSVNLVLLVAKILCYFFNELALKHFLINETFSTPDYEETDKKKKKNPEKFGFSIWNLLYSTDSEKSSSYFYSQAKKGLFEYLDIKNIINRLQDIDKLKLVVFSENQRVLFDSVPKPAAMGKLRRNLAKPSLELFKKRPSLKKNEIKEVLAEEDIFTKRILNLIDPSLCREKPSDFLIYLINCKKCSLECEPTVSSSPKFAINPKDVSIFTQTDQKTEEVELVPNESIKIRFPENNKKEMSV